MGTSASSHVKLAAVEMSFGWPLPKYAIPVFVSVWLEQVWMWMFDGSTDHRRRKVAGQRYWHHRQRAILLASRWPRLMRGWPRRRKARKQLGASLCRCSWKVRQSWDLENCCTRRGTIKIIYLSSHGCIDTRSLLKELSFWDPRPRPL
jgi:hypothetical protein